MYCQKHLATTLQDGRAIAAAAEGLKATWASPIPATRHGLVCSEGTAVVEGPDQFEFDSLRVAP